MQRAAVKRRMPAGALATGPERYGQPEGSPWSEVGQNFHSDASVVRKVDDIAQSRHSPVWWHVESPDNFGRILAIHTNGPDRTTRNDVPMRVCVRPTIGCVQRLELLRESQVCAHFRPLGHTEVDEHDVPTSAVDS